MTENGISKGCNRLGASYLKIEAQPASETLCFMHLLHDGQSAKEEECICTFTCKPFVILS